MPIKLKNLLQSTKKSSYAIGETLKFALKFDLFGTLLIVITNAAGSAMPMLIGWEIKLIIDMLSSKGLGSRDSIYINLGLLGLTLLFQVFIGIYNGYIQRRSFRILNRSIQYLTTSKIASLDMADYDSPKTYDLIHKVKENYAWVINNFLLTSLTLIGDLIGIIGTSIALGVVTGPVIVMLVALLLLPEVIINLVLSKKSWGIGNASVETRREFTDISSYLQNQQRLLELTIYQYKNYLLERAYSLYDKYLLEVNRYENKRLFIYIAISILTAGGMTLPIVFYIHNSIGTISFEAGSIVFLFATTSSFNTLFSKISRNIAHIYETSLHANDIFSLQKIKKRIENGNTKISSDKIKIEFVNVSFKYPKHKRYIFKDLSFTIEPEEKVAIVGENGAGKSTLIKLLCRSYDVNSGEILINGVNIKEIDLTDYYSHISLLVQEFGSFHFDAKTNIGLGNIAEISNTSKIKEAAKMANADTFIEKYPQKYNQVLSRHYPKGIEPSYGQWQKIAIARALFRNPEILILDEPTSAIDPVSEFEIFQNLYKYTKDKTLIVISHRFSTVKNADRILVMDNGTIIESGSHKELMDIDGKYANAYRIQKESLTKGDDELLNNN